MTTQHNTHTRVGAWLSKKVASISGMTLGELMAALLIIALLTTGLVTSVGFATNQYKKSMTNSESQQLYSTLETVISKELRYTTQIAGEGIPQDMTDLEWGTEYNVESFYSADYGNTASLPHLYALDDEGNAMDDGMGQLALCSDDGESEVKRLIGKADYNFGLRAQVTKLTFKSGYFTVDLKVGLPGEDAMVDQVFHVRALNLTNQEDSAAVDNYAICFKANGAEGEDYTQRIKVGESATLDPCTFAAPEGKVFAGWAITSDGEVVYSDGEEVSDLAGVGETVALYAIWEDAAKLTFSSTSPVDSAVTSMAFAAGSTVTTSGFVIDGYELLG